MPGRLIFVDTGPLFSLAVKSDQHHERARILFGTPGSTLVTTDFIIDELLTLLRARKRNRLAVELGIQLLEEGLAEVIWVTKRDVTEAWGTFRKFHDKQWSFTDCVSRVIIERIGIPFAFAFDEHFRQFGNVIVVSQ